MTVRSLLAAPALAAALLLTACGGTPPAPAPAAAAPTSAPAPAPTSAAPASTITGVEEQAAATAWRTVFDSKVPAAEKSAYLADPAAAAPVLAAYEKTGTQVGGIALKPTAVSVTGDSATVTYDILFGGNPAYQGQTGTVVRKGTGWVVAPAQFCSFMAQARTPCG